MNGAQYLQRVRELPCCACEKGVEVQHSQTEAHHVFHDRFSGRRTNDFHAIPLCNGHHSGDFDTSKLAIHRNKAAWREEYGPDHSFSKATQIAILGQALELEDA